jgi:phenol hydroxylase P3 protein
MDMSVKRKLGLKEKYHLMTRDLSWDPSYQKEDEIYPQLKYEGIKIHDWDKWEDPFRLTVDAYWKYQSEKERKLYAIIDAFNQNNGHLNLTDARYLNAIKLWLNGITPLEYEAHRGYARLGREFKGVGASIACQMQSIDELRHAQTQIHAMSNYNRFYNGFDDWHHKQDHMWYYSVPKSFFEDAMSAGPFEFITAISFSFEYVLTNLLFVPFVSGAAYNGDMAAMTFGFSAQSDESRHMTLGLEVIKFMLEQDPDNLPIVQSWIDKWTWRGTRLLTLVGMMQDYMLPKRVMSWKEAWEMYFEGNGMALFNDLARYGIKVPEYVEQIRKEKDHISHQAWLTFNSANFLTNFHTWIPNKEELDWLSAKYPESFDKYYRPRFEYFKKLEDEGKPFFTKGLPVLCQVCQIPIFYTDPDNPTELAGEEGTYLGSKFQYCSKGCKTIFEREPEKYVQAWLPVNQIFQGTNFPAGTDPTVPGFDPIRAVADFYQLDFGRENGPFEASEDKKNFSEWRDKATKN